MQAHEIELEKKFMEDEEYSAKIESFKESAISELVDVLKTDGDIVDAINDMDLRFDNYLSLEDSDINDIVIKAVLKFTED